MDEEDITAPVLKICIVDYEAGPTEIGVGLDDGCFILPADVICCPVVGPDRKAVFVGVFVGLDNSLGIVGNSIANGSE